MPKIGEQFPSFSLQAIASAEENNDFIQLNEQSFPEKWKIYFFWPNDFTFVCPTEIAEFGRLNQEFKDREAEILGLSTDSAYVHLAWKKQAAELTDLPFPMLADSKRELSSALNILDTQEGVAQRAVFIVDPRNVIRFVMVTDLNVGRNPKEVLRVLDALQTKALCPCNWEKGEKTLTVPVAGIA